MIITNNIAAYALFAIVTFGKKSFENIGRVIKKSGDTISRMLRPGHESIAQSQQIAQEVFKNKKELKVVIDETIIRKVYSRSMEGIGYFFDTKIACCINAYKLIVSAITDVKYIIPINSAFTFGKEFYNNPAQAKEATVIYFINVAKALFPSSRIIIVLDGAFATVKYLKWAI